MEVKQRVEKNEIDYSCINIRLLNIPTGEVVALSSVRFVYFLFLNNDIAN